MSESVKSNEDMNTDWIFPPDDEAEEESWFKRLHDKRASQFDESNLSNVRLKQCQENKLSELKLSGKTIKEIPDEIKHFYWLEELSIINTQLTSFKQSDFPDNLKTLIIKSNDIKFIDCSIFPKTLEKLIYTNNCTSEIIGLELNEKLVEVDLSNNKLCEINSLPISLKSLDISSNISFSKLPILHEGLIKLYINTTKIDNIDTLPDSLQILTTIRCCQLTEVNKLPKNLESWQGFMGGLKTINCEFPKTLKVFDVFDNDLEYVPDFPLSIKTIDLSKNKLKYLPIFPYTIKSIDLKENISLNNEQLKKIKTLILEKNPDVEFTLDNDSSSSSSDSSPTEMPSRFNFFNRSLFMSRFKTEDDDFTSDNPHYIILKKHYVL